MNYAPFGGPYGGYTPGGQQMPGPMPPHPGMMASMMPPRIPTPPPVQPMSVTRSRTPSPETVLSTAPGANTEQVKVNESQDKSTSQQGTQTVQTKKRPSSRPSSRRNSEDKTEAAQEKKKQEANDKENINKESGGTNQSTAEPQRQRQGIEILKKGINFKLDFIIYTAYNIMEALAELWHIKFRQLPKHVSKAFSLNGLLVY